MSILTDKQKTIWKDRGAEAARGDAKTRQAKQPMASGDIRPLLEAWLVQDGASERELTAMDELDREAAYTAALEGYLAEAYGLEVGP